MRTEEKCLVYIPHLKITHAESAGLSFPFNALNPTITGQLLQIAGKKTLLLTIIPKLKSVNNANIVVLETKT